MDDVEGFGSSFLEEAFGGLKPETRKELERLIKAYRSNPDTSFKQKLKLKSGTRLVRSWKNKPHEVVATENGFFYRGKEYGSLTEVAGKITIINNYPKKPAFGGDDQIIEF